MTLLAVLFGLTGARAEVSTPTNVTVTDVENIKDYDGRYYSAKVSWTQQGEAESWEVIYSTKQNFSTDTENRHEYEMYCKNITTPYYDNYHNDGNHPLLLESTYYVRVRAKKGEEFSAWSEEVSFTAEKNPRPTCVRTTDLKYTSASVSWTAPQSNIAGYYYQCKKASEEWQSSNTETAGTSADFTGLENNTTYNFRVKTIYTNNVESEWATLDFTTPEQFPKPTDLTVTDLTANSASISWTAPGRPVEGYTYQYKKDSENTWSTETAVTATSVALSELSSNTTYNFRVKANYSDGASEYVSKDFTTEYVMCYISYELEANAYQGAYDYGWYGSGIEVIDAQTNKRLAFWTVDMGNSSATGTLSVYDGQELRFEWYCSYSTGNDNILVKSYSITDADGNVITSGEGPMSSDVSFILNCNGLLSPTNIAVTEISSDRAKFSWEGNHDSYVLQYRKAAQAMPLNVWQQVGDDVTATGVLTPYTFDLSGFTGTGAIAIRHYNVSNMYRLNIDDIEVTNAEGTVILSENFESGNIPAEWSIVDYDGDGYNWSTIHLDDNNGHYNGDYCATSASYANYKALTPDNWLIIPNVELGGTLTFVARGQDASWPAENFGVFVTQQSFDAVQASDWVEVSTADHSKVITGLTANTTYDWLLKAIVGAAETAWSHGQFTTLAEGIKAFISNGNWDVADNWIPAGVPTADDILSIQADATIPSGVIALAKKASLDGGSITIMDGGQLKQGSATLDVILNKAITAAKNNLIATPLSGSTNFGYSSTWNYMDVEDSGSYDCYQFDASETDEWLNFKNGNNYLYRLYPGEGYLFDYGVATTLYFAGTALSSTNNTITQDVTYDGTSTNAFNGWMLVGNPFTCNGLVTYSENATFYKLNAAGTGYVKYENGVVLAPGEGAFMQVAASGTITYSSEEPATAINGSEATGTLPMLPLHGLKMNQNASYYTLQDNGTDNATVMTALDGVQADIQIAGRTLTPDVWSPLCLPFDVPNLDNSSLKGCAVRELDTQADATFFDNGTLNLKFKDVSFTSGNGIKAGKPYIVKVDANAAAIVNPLFSGVTIDNAVAPTAVTSADEKVSFLGIYEPKSITGPDQSLLFIGTDNKVYYPNANVSIKAFRAYFPLNGISAADISTTRMIFGDEEVTGISNVNVNDSVNWYDLNGRKIAQPTKKGVYILNGKKTVIK